MSVFGDFRNVWVQRFPGSDLPAAWEEDVRANLAKHKQKVAVLREELEKEEFYVEYLEQLLIDVAKHKTRGTSDETSNDDKKAGEGTDWSNVKCRTTEMQGMGLEESSETSGNNVGDNIQSSLESVEATHKDSANQCITELSATLPDAHCIGRSNSDVPNRNRVSETERPRCNTHPDISNYVTVIEVNGLNVVKGECMKEALDSQGAATKKKPPTPPPKKFFNKSKSGKNSSVNSVDREYNAGGQVEEVNDEQYESDVNEMPDEAAAACPRTRGAESVDAEVKLEEDLVQENLREDASSVNGVLPDDDEPYYDSVALDGEYVYLQNGKYLRTELCSIILYVRQCLLLFRQHNLVWTHYTLLHVLAYCGHHQVHSVLYSPFIYVCYTLASVYTLGVCCSGILFLYCLCVVKLY
jgi:breakpoint cluster region protein